MPGANIVKALNSDNKFYRVTLSGIVIYGRVRTLIERPKFLGNSVMEGSGYHAILDAYALKCLAQDYFIEKGMGRTNGLYATKGSILIYVDSPDWVGKDVKVSGKTSSGGCKIRRQDVPDKACGVSAYEFGSPQQYGRSKRFPLVCNMLAELGTNTKEFKGTFLEDMMVQIIGSKPEKIPYSSSVDGLIEYKGTDEYQELSIEEEETLKTSGTQLEYHLEGRQVSKYYEDFKEDLESNKESRKVFVSESLLSVKESFTDEAVTSICDTLKSKFIQNIASYPTERIGKGKLRCKNIIDEFVSVCGDLTNLSNEKQTEEATQNILRGLEYLRKNIFVSPDILYGGSDADTVPAISSSQIFAMAVIAVCSGLGIDKLKANYSNLSRNNGVTLSFWLYLLFNNPYLLALIGVGLSTVEADVLFYSFARVFRDSDCATDVKGTREKLQFLDTLNARAEKNTFSRISDFKHDMPVYSGGRYLDSSDFPAKKDTVSTLEKLLGISLKLSPTAKAYLANKRWYSEKLQLELCNIGVVNIYDDSSIALERDLEEEMIIYETFIKLGNLETGITDNVIEPTISKFEEDRGFKLEALQRDAIKLCKKRAGVLSGCAGSGKTTTSDCMTEVLKSLSGYKIVYCAPTGKAARRLSEVVHAPVKTIHSQFGVGLGGSSYMKAVYKKPKKPGVGKVIYILDEMAMCSTDLMYELARNLADEDIIYLLGDVKQLPPIGKGCPFKTLMKLLPCIELGVSKRAAEGSLVNYNTSVINFKSDGVLEDLKYDSSSFLGMPAQDTALVSSTVEEFSNYMKGMYDGKKFPEDDIQVISGYKSNSHSSSTVKLNRSLQEVLRGNQTPLYYRSEDTEVLPYYVGDRVIHTNVNSYSMCKYINTGNNTLQMLITFGVVNGTMGKIVGLVKPKDILIQPVEVSDCVAGEGLYANVSEEDLENLKGLYESKEDSLRDDAMINGDKDCFVVVSVYDIDLKMDVLVLYRATESVTTEGLLLRGQDLYNLDLAYALTCHKMQGSQSPVVIIPLESSSSPTFINRNMLNTMVTRSQGYVCLIGDIEGSDSILSRGRRKVSEVSKNDLLNILLEE